MITNPAKIIEHIIHKEVQYDSDNPDLPYNEILIEDSDGEAINNDIQLAFTVHDKQINSKKLIEGIASNCRLIPYIKNNTLILKGINPAPYPELTTTVIDEDEQIFGSVETYIDQSDIISYTNKRTAPEKVYSKVTVNYHYDYALKEFTKNTMGGSDNPDTATEYFEHWEDPHESGIPYNDENPLYNIINLGLKAEQELLFEAHYIREDSIPETYSAGALQEFLLLWHCNQHNILKLRLPLKYIQLKIGDYIGFDKLINGVKLLGEDYSIEHYNTFGGNIYRNGQQILPVWMITSTNKTLTHIDVEMIQMHNCKSTPLHGLGIQLTEMLPESIEVTQIAHCGVESNEAGHLLVLQIQMNLEGYSNYIAITPTVPDLDEYFNPQQRRTFWEILTDNDPRFNRWDYLFLDGVRVGNEENWRAMSVNGYTWENDIEDNPDNLPVLRLELPDMTWEINQDTLSSLIEDSPCANGAWFCPGGYESLENPGMWIFDNPSGLVCNWDGFAINNTEIGSEGFWYFHTMDNNFLSDITISSE
jgi:hypothetical protein